MKRFIIGVGVGATLSFLTIRFLSIDIFSSTAFDNTRPLVTTHCPSIKTIELAATRNGADFDKGFTIWEKKTNPIAGEKIGKWLKAETKIYEYLKVGVTHCTYEAVALNDELPRKIIISTYPTRLDHVDFINDPNWILENKIIPTDGQYADKWQFVCVNSRTTCRFDIHS